MMGCINLVNLSLSLPQLMIHYFVGSKFCLLISFSLNFFKSLVVSIVSQIIYIYRACALPKGT
jgi:hypothetical protein